MGKEKSFTNVSGTTEYFYGKKRKTPDPYPILYTNINSWWATDLNVKAK